MIKLGNKKVTEYWRKVFDGPVEMGKVRISKHGDQWEYAYYLNIPAPSCQAPVVKGSGFSHYSLAEYAFKERFNGMD